MNSAHTMEYHELMDRLTERQRVLRDRYNALVDQPPGARAEFKQWQRRLDELHRKAEEIVAARLALRRAMRAGTLTKAG